MIKLKIIPGSLPFPTLSEIQQTWTSILLKNHGVIRRLEMPLSGPSSILTAFENALASLSKAKVDPQDIGASLKSLSEKKLLHPSVSKQLTRSYERLHDIRTLLLSDDASSYRAREDFFPSEQPFLKEALWSRTLFQLVAVTGQSDTYLYKELLYIMEGLIHRGAIYRKPLDEDRIASMTRIVYQDINYIERFMSGILAMSANETPSWTQLGTSPIATTQNGERLYINSLNEIDIPSDVAITDELFHEATQQLAILGLPLSLNMLLKMIHREIEQQTLMSRLFTKKPNTSDLANRLLGKMGIALSHGHLHHYLDTLNAIGSLETLIPEWGFLSGRIQRSSFHAFPVDIHSLQVARNFEMLHFIAKHISHESKFLLKAPISEADFKVYSQSQAFQVLQKFPYLFKTSKLDHYMELVRSGDLIKIQSFLDIEGDELEYEIKSGIKQVSHLINQLPSSWQSRLQDIADITPRALGVLLHDIGKGGSYENHEVRGYEILQDRIKNWAALSTHQREMILEAVHFHGINEQPSFDVSDAQDPIFGMAMAQIQHPFTVFMTTLSDRLGASLNSKELGLALKVMPLFSNVDDRQLATHTIAHLVSLYEEVYADILSPSIDDPEILRTTLLAVADRLHRYLEQMGPLYVTSLRIPVKPDEKKALVNQLVLSMSQYNALKTKHETGDLRARFSMDEDSGILRLYGMDRPGLAAQVIRMVDLLKVQPLRFKFFTGAEFVIDEIHFKKEDILYVENELALLTGADFVRDTFSSVDLISISKQHQEPATGHKVPIKINISNNFFGEYTYLSGNLTQGLLQPSHLIRIMDLLKQKNFNVEYVQVNCPNAQAGQSHPIHELHLLIRNLHGQQPAKSSIKKLETELRTVINGSNKS